MSLEQVLILEHVADSGWDGHLLPCLEGLLGVLDGSVEFIVGRLRNLTHKFLCGLLSSIRLFQCMSLTGLITSKERGPLDSTHCPLIKFLYYTKQLCYRLSIFDFSDMWMFFVLEFEIAYTLREMSLGSLWEHRY